jgi:hypothetical protein
MRDSIIPDISATHEQGAAAFGLLWLHANIRASAVLHGAGVDFDSRSGREYAAITSAIVLEVLRTCATGPAIRLLTRAAAEERLAGGERS